MPRVSASSTGPALACTCPSVLKPSQILAAMGRASEVTVEYQHTEMDGTLVFHAWTRPENVYTITYHPSKQGHQLCKHGIAASAHIVGPWLTEGLTQIRKEKDECLKLRKEHRKLQKNLVAAARAMLKVKPMMPSDT